MYIALDLNMTNKYFYIITRMQNYASWEYVLEHV